jgi:hypothetical protein
MIIAIKSLTRALSAAAQFANAHRLIVAALFLAIAIGLIGLGAISLVKTSRYDRAEAPRAEYVHHQVAVAGCRGPSPRRP